MRLPATPAPTRTILPQQSAPWISGNPSGIPLQAPSAGAAALSCPVAAVPDETSFEYHPIRVLMSVC